MFITLNELEFPSHTVFRLSMFQTPIKLPVFLPKILQRVLFCLIAGGIMLLFVASPTDDNDMPANFKPFPCFMDADDENTDDSIIRLDDVLRADVKPTQGKNIFFHETSCHPPGSKYIMNLTARQACSIESAALHNPNFGVFVLFASPTYLPGAESPKLPLIEALQSYKNVHLRQLNIWRYAKGTPAEEWVNKGDLFDSSYLKEHVSDYLRILSLYRFGGIYLDIDVVVLRTMENIPLNYVGAEEPGALCNAVFSLDSTGIGHEIAELCLNDFQENFNGQGYISNGPSLVMRMTKQVCNSTSIEEIVAEQRNCNGFRVFNTTAFYPIPWPAWRRFVEPQYLNETLEQTKDSYLIHLWNKVSKELKFKKGDDTAYGKYAQEHCPKVNAAADEYF
ncbi:lactosylceramide 4-alpha-galactosyltransferase-like [Drosophila sulfurigaster albostrigata]|uniref:lactosylceramide 4-alpha-galactosyltransferase-like n=1 Tax=Drosophila sulfurigaster albostrigata TaxID=89887 RepID=UPI002D2187E8|nr:lactosylceramide 4-alpha-galactosyltransferase-like [Drosophila sulfurigaster albostrigata]XP_062126019.1 lactosylceramide 4-alpha-galactosyltransferase-like [Drosophila sulfurigaster albostrigata]